MTWIEDIGTYLQTQGKGTLGTSIFYEEFSLSSPNCILLIDQPGLPSITTLGKGMTLRKPELGVRVRNQNDDTAHAKADEIYNLLHLKTNTVIGSTRFKKIKCIAEPFYLSKDPNNNHIWSINFNLEIG
jgi:hypothetical protein